MAQDLHTARRALLDDGRAEEAITVNQRALIDKILARYSAEFTVFRELLQNADDAGATDCELRFATSATVAHTLLPARTNPGPQVPDTTAPLTQWTFRNNGKPFSSDDWNRLRRIAEGNPDPDRIGAFGVGFYSLFSICEEPIVFSGSELMGFFWKGDALFTRRANVSDPQVSSNGVPWTTFLMALREPTPFPESPLALCRFLATSLTFTANVRHVALYVDDQLLCRLEKHTGSPQPVSASRHLNGRSPGKLLQVSTVESIALRVDLYVARMVLLEAAAEAEHEKPNLKQTLLSAFSRTAGAGITSMLSSAFGGLTTSTSSAANDALDAQSLLEMVHSTLHLRIATAHIRVSLDAAFSREIERSTKKPLPKQTLLHMVYMGKEEYDATTASDAKASDTHYSDLDKHTRRLFSGLMPSLDAQGRVFIGFRTHQTTSFSGHMAARFIPTVERESLDFVDRYCARWNMELLAIGGYLARVMYEAELHHIGERWAQGTLDAEHKAHVVAMALHVMRFFSFHASSPSKRVAATLEDTFFACCSKPCISLLSTHGARSSDQVRFPSALLSDFIQSLPVIPAELIEKAETFVLQLRARDLVRDITMDDVFAELGGRALSVPEMVACLNWWIMVAEHPSYDAALLPRLLQNAMVMMEPEGDAVSRIQALSDVRTVLHTQKVPPHVPLPPTCLVYPVSRQLRVHELQQVFGWSELSMAEWIDYMISLDTSPAKQVAEQHGLTHDAANAEKVFGTLAWAWSNLPNAQRTHIAAALETLPCIPTRLGMRKPNDAYFSSVSLFEDLAVVTFPTLAVKGNLEKVLDALHVRRHVEIQLIFDRLIAAGDWSHAELIGYLTKHRDLLSNVEWERLRSTAIFPKEDMDGNKRYQAAELYEPVEELRALGLPVLDWGRSWRTNSDEARFLATLGLRKQPPLADILTLASAVNTDAALRRRAFQHLLDKFSGVYAATYTMSIASKHAFVPVKDKGVLLPPSQVYTDGGVAAMDFPVADVAPVDALKLKLRAHPESAQLVQRLLHVPPTQEDHARHIFVFLASVREFTQKDLAELRCRNVIPVRRKESVGMVAPRDCYFMPTHSQSIAPQYREIFHYIDFGPTAAVFLRSIGVTDEPSVEELTRKLVSDPPRFYDLCGSTETYLEVLRRIATHLDALSSDTMYTIKRTPFLLAFRKGSADDEGGGAQEYALRCPRDVVIVDDAHAHMLFAAHMYAAPHDDVLEELLYAPLGAQYLSSLVDESYTTAGQYLADTPKAQQVHDTILERTPLFLFEKTIASSKEVQHDYTWLKRMLHVVEVDGDGLQLTRTFSSGDTQCKDVQRCSAMVTLTRKSLVLHVAGNMDVDWFEVALALNKHLLTRQHLQEVLLFMTVLSTPLQSLKRKGFHVDKIMAQQRQTPSAPVIAAPQLDFDGWTKELLQMFPDAEPGHVNQLLRVFENDHLQQAGSALLQGNYPRVQTQRKSEAPRPIERTAATAPLPPPVPANLKEPSQIPMPQPPISSGGLFQSWKQRLGNGKLSSLASGSSSIKLPGQANGHRISTSTPPVLPPRQDTEHVASSANIRQHVQQAIQASRPESARVIQSKTQEQEVRHAASTYCDVTGVNTNLRLAGRVSGMSVYVSAELDAGQTLNTHMEALYRLIDLVYRPIGTLFGVDQRCLSVFYDTKGPSIAFNRGGSIFLNLRYYLAWHDANVQHGRLTEPLISVYFSMAHELAHNLVAEHNSEHEFYFSSIAEQHVLRLVEALARAQQNAL
ncbi:hypothetical protein MVES_002504 [Malassezia vespertilionis]|uniref:Sacsin/Nov domain-containing protein n=2 Tax=Malassezia vespertilionis TaxID=2020962 RepID=A0A2N1JA42_9BASI|nr:hypothetical protein MVES_002504 [Malassezia vespertilionis]